MYNAGGMSTTTVVGQPATIVTHSPPSTNERYNGKQSVVIGILLIIVGALGIVFNIVDIAVSNSALFESYGSFYHYSSNGYSGHGFWCGIVFIITGVFGIVAGRTKNRCLIIVFLIMAIIGCVFAGIQFIISCVGAGSMGELNDLVCPSSSQSTFCDKVRALVAMEALLAIGAAVAFALCLWGSILCCNGSSSGPQPRVFAVVPSQQTTVITQQQQQQQPQAYYPGMQPGYPVAIGAPASAGYVQQPPPQFGVAPPAYGAGGQQPPAGVTTDAKY